MSSAAPPEPRVGRQESDCELAADGLSSCVRAERAGTGPTASEGLRHAVPIVATDACGNTSDAQQFGAIHVPHDRRDLAKAACRGDGSAP